MNTTDPVLATIDNLSFQIRQALDETKNLSLPTHYKSVTEVVVSAMGGSLMNYFATYFLFADSLTVPLLSLNDYQLPNWLDKNSLLYCNSYSGTTEETLSAAYLAFEQQYNIFGQTTGGKLGKWLIKNEIPHYIYDPKYNYSQQPRLAIGYNVFGLVGVLMNLGLLKFNFKEIEDGIENHESKKTDIKEKAVHFINVIKDRVPIFIAGGHLKGVVHLIRNNFHETAKHYCEYHLLPELNHHLMEGLTFPKKLPLMFIFFDSPLYYPRNRQRLVLTRQVIENQGYHTEIIDNKPLNRIDDFLAFLFFGLYSAYYLSQHHHVDPKAIPFVDYFKAHLKDFKSR